MLTTALILFPLAFSLILFVIREDRKVLLVAATGVLGTLALAIAAWVQYRYVCACHLTAHSGWLDPVGISLTVGLDGISLLMVLLTAFLVPFILFGTSRRDLRRPAVFFGLILLMEAALIGVFAAKDGLLFYVFWEMALIPAWFICAVWGGEDRIRITFRFFAYTFTGSLFMLAALIWLWFRTPLPHSFGAPFLYAALLSPGEQAWVFAAFFLAFAVKIPVFPFHSWQPDTYTVSPSAGTMLLAALMGKMGIYGMIRWMLPVVPDAIFLYGPVAVILALTGLVYASVIAIRQQDIKRLLAYSSMAHVGLIAAGVLAMNAMALHGAVIQMISHGVIIVGLFLVTDQIERRTGTRIIGNLGGVATKAPWLSVFFMIFLLGSIALPLTSGFVGEFMLLGGLFAVNPWYAAAGGLSVILSAVYMLWMYQRVMFGTPNDTGLPQDIRDLGVREILLLAPLAAVVLWIGIFPAAFLDLAEPAVTRIMMLIQ